MTDQGWPQVWRKATSLSGSRCRGEASRSATSSLTDAFTEIGAYQDSVAVSVLTPSVGATVESPTAGWGANALYLGHEMHVGGFAGLALSGDVAIDSIVAQGCRPIGPPLFVTQARHNLVTRLDGRPAMEVLAEIYAALGARDQQLCQHSLFVGIAMVEGRDRYQQGDFLIRNLVGTVRENGGLVIGAEVTQHQVIQFHLRDAETSTLDLRTLLDRYRTEHGTATPAGALLFSCLGRGEGLYGVPDHDSALSRETLGDHPIGGFFANGEIGPVEGRTFLHGYTSSFGLFRRRER